MLGASNYEHKKVNTPDIIEEVVDLAKSYARQYYLTAEENDSEENLKKKEVELRQVLTTIYQRGRESKEQEYGDLTICNRKNVHTCRLNAIHIPDNYLGKFRHLTSPENEHTSTTKH